MNVFSVVAEEEIDVVSVGTTTQQPLPAAPHVRTDSLPRSPSAQQQHHLHHTMLTHVSPRQRPVARKRLVPPPSIAAGQRRRARGPSRRGRRSNTDTDSEAEAPEMERRSIHNDMERLRRIGLKNLFDELKKQIPATREKERAPKVVILREAASLCRKLYLEDIERDKLKKKQNQLMSKLKKLRTMLAVRYRSYWAQNNHNGDRFVPAVGTPESTLHDTSMDRVTLCMSASGRSLNSLVYPLGCGDEYTRTP